MSQYSFVILIGVLIASISQIFLKKSAEKKYSSFVYEYFNIQVLIGYLLMFFSVFLNLYALNNGVNVKEVPVIESLGFIFVPILSILFLNERLVAKQYAAIVLILSGIFVFYL